MTVRHQCRLEYQRTHASVRRIVLLGAIVLAGMLLGYRGAASPVATVTPASYGTIAAP